MDALLGGVILCVCVGRGGEGVILEWIHAGMGAFCGGFIRGWIQVWDGFILGWSHPGVDSSWGGFILGGSVVLLERSQQTTQTMEKKRARDYFLRRAPWPDPPDSSKNPDLANFEIPDLPDSNKNPHLSNLRKQLTPH